MERDTLFGEPIIWDGKSELVRTPSFWVASAVVLLATCVVCSAFAVLSSLAFDSMPVPQLLTAVVTGGLGVLAMFGPTWWFARERYLITENQVIAIMGPFRRSIRRDSITFSRIFWDSRCPEFGTLELVRAVQAGALRRRLTVRLVGLRAPDRVLAIIRGTETLTPVGIAYKPLGVRLDLGERVLWTGSPRPHYSAYLPHGPREWGQLALAVVLLATLYGLATSSARIAQIATDGGLALTSAIMLSLFLAQLTTAALLCAGVVMLTREALMRGVQLIRHTRYLITDRRVLIQRGREELHLSRQHIIDVIDSPTGHRGLTDVFFVLDGPRARTVALSGAFGELQAGPHLRPVLFAVEDAEGVTRAIQTAPPSRPGPFPRAA